VKFPYVCEITFFEASSRFFSTFNVVDKSVQGRHVRETLS